MSFFFVTHDNICLFYFETQLSLNITSMTTKAEGNITHCKNLPLIWVYKDRELYLLVYNTL